IGDLLQRRRKSTFTRRMETFALITARTAAPRKFRAGSNRTAYAPVGIARADDAGHSFPHRAYCRTHRVPRQCYIGFPLLVLDRNGLFDFAEFPPGIFQERSVSGAIRVLELLVREVLRV